MHKYDFGKIAIFIFIAVAGCSGINKSPIKETADGAAGSGSITDGQASADAENEYDANQGGAGGGKVIPTLDGGKPTCARNNGGCNVWATCDDSSGEVVCTCPEGYDGDGKNCWDINECGDAALNDCDENATCENISQSYTCTCKEGYSGDGKTCTDVDECKLGKCDKNANCTNTPGSYTCECKTGFTGDGKTCTDINECQKGLATCHPNATCVNKAPGFECVCNTGFKGDGYSCEEIDECAADPYPCGNNTDCTNIPSVPGTFDCECQYGYGGDPYDLDVGCVPLCDIAQADPAVCDPNGHGICVIVDGVAQCNDCETGYVGNGKTCTLDTNCTGKGCGPNTDCVDTGGGVYDCACKSGYEGNPKDSVTGCTDIDQCAKNTDNCDDSPNACVNDNPGTFHCVCPDGYSGNGVGSDGCVNVNECAPCTPYTTGCPCDPNATCTDKTPHLDGVKYTCLCNSGYTGSGTACADIKECKESSPGICDSPTSTCVCDPNIASCTCNSSYSYCQNTMGGFNCLDNNECTKNTDNCDDTPDACVNDINTGYHCTCPAGYAGNGVGTNGCYCDLSGYWGMRELARITWGDNVGIIKGTLDTNVYELHKYTYDGSTVVVYKKGCGQDQWPELQPTAAAVIYLQLPGPETYSSYIPPEKYDPLSLLRGSDIALDHAVPGAAFSNASNPEVAIVGLKTGVAWPTGGGTIDEKDWDDTDGDGEPGLTTWSYGPANAVRVAEGKGGDGNIEYTPLNSPPTRRIGCMSGAVYMKMHLDGNLDSCSKITGGDFTKRTGGVTIEGNAARIHSCALAESKYYEDTAHSVTCDAAYWNYAKATSGMMCTADEVNALNNVSQTQKSSAAFTLVKLPDTPTPTCQTVRNYSW